MQNKKFTLLELDLKGHFVGMPDDKELTTDKVQNGLITWF
jgi:hypothetical protein